MSQRLSKKSLFHYSFLAFPLAFAGLPLYVHVPDLYTRELGLNLGLIGIILIFLRLFDAIQDPIIGYVSDHYYQHRKYLLAVGFISLILGMAALFYGSYSPIPIALWFSLSMILATTGFSILVINQTMIGGLWQDNIHERTRISSWREAMGLMGLLTASALPVMIESFQTFFWIFSIFLITGFLLFFKIIKNINLPIQSQKLKVSFSFLKIIAGENVLFYFTVFLSSLSASIPAVLVLFFIRDYLNEEKYTAIFLTLYFLSGVFFIGLWTKLSAKLGKNRAWLYAMILSILTFVWALFLEPNNLITYAVICILSGIALGGDLSLPASILADRISRQNSQNEATQFYAALVFIPKLAIALGTGIAFLILDFYEFSAGADNSTQSLKALILLYALIPCLIKISAAFLLWYIHYKEGEK